ncbi:MAG TPA: two-component regulator propeller domain-containing protein, partial [Rhodothermales bacterium]|nr:two-component regulator propeller domain-containing protein [Rhodothermales bacterium]
MPRLFSSTYVGPVPGGLLLLLCLIVVPEVFAQRLVFKHLKGSDGLSHAHVEAILQDQLGFMWFGTRGGGLNRYDGYEFVVYEHDSGDSTSLLSNNITGLYEDTKGDLWISSWEGLSRYNRARDDFDNWREGDGSGLLGWANAVTEGLDGHLWVATTKGLNCYNQDTDTFERYVHDPGDPASLSGIQIRDIVVDRLGSLWVATDGGLDVRRPGDRGFTHFRHDPTDPSSLPANDLRGLEIDSRGWLWVATDDGGLARLDLNALERGFDRFQHDPSDAASLATDRLRTVYEDSQGRLWIGTENGGLDRFDYDTETFVHSKADPDDPRSLSHDSIWSIYEDRTGRLWFGTFAGGLNSLQQNSDVIAHFRSIPGNEASLKSNAVSVFHEDQEGTLWVGTDGGGFHLFDPASRRFRRYNTENTNLPSNAVLALHRDRDGFLWVGGWAGGLARFDPRQERFVAFYNVESGHLLTNNVFDVMEDAEGNIWAVDFRGGLVRIDPETGTAKVWTSENSRLAHNENLSVMVAPGGDLVVTSQNYGVNIFDPKTETFTTYNSNRDNPTAATSLSNDNVQAVAAPDEHTLWIGTQNGLNRLDRRTETVEQYYKEDGLPSNQIAGLAFDDQGHLWVATNKGICRFNVAARTCKIFTTDDGLQSNDFIRFSYLRTSSGKLLFGGPNGFNMIHPDRLKENTFVPPVVLTDFQLFNRPVEIGGEESPLQQHISVAEEVVLSYEQNVLTFTFAALDFMAPVKNLYAYKLDGFDAAWNEVGTKRTATYSNLDPGIYVLRVRGSNNDGVWNEQGASLRVIILPPFWQTWWFRGLEIFCILGVVILMVQGARRLGQTEIIREKLKVEEELKDKAEAASRAKGEFLANMSHEIRTPMNGVMGMLELALSTPLTETQRAYLTMAETSAASLLTVINDILDFSKIEAGKLTLEATPFDLRERLGSTLKSLALRAHRKGLELVLDVAPEVPEVVVGDPVRLAQVLVNLVGNAIKFTEKGEVVVVVDEAIPEDRGRASVAVAHHGKEAVTLHFTVRDTGIGIPQEKQAQIFGAFEQADMSTTRQYGGTGLGLVIASRLVQLMGGEIWVESTPGQGSIFHFTAHLEQDARSMRQPLRAVQDLQVLVVDDNATNGYMLERMLESWGMESVVVTDGAEALQRLIMKEAGGSSPYSLVFLDYQMPNMDGLDVARQIRQQWGPDEVALVMLTSVTEQHLAKQASGLHVAAYLMKPCTPSEIFDSLMAVLQGASPAPGIQASANGSDAESHFKGVDHTRQPLRLLLAEDNVINQQFAIHVLEQAGHRVEVADNGQMAVAAYRRDSFDLVLMDVQMPVMNGYEATSHIRALEAATGQHVLIIALTAHARKEDHERSIEAGMDAYLSKPVRI